MKFLLLSDIHATTQNPIGRKDNILATFKKKITFVLKYAKKRNMSILQSGDMFDKARDWHILDTMTDLLKKYKVPIYTIFGQHDLYMRADPDTTPTTLGILAKLGLITILSADPTIIGKVNIYGCNWKATAPKPKRNQINILVIHAPITTKELFPKHDFTAVSYYISKNKGWDLILTGDIHAKTIYSDKKTTLINTGPLLRLSSIKYNFTHKPCFFVYDTRLHQTKEIIIPYQKAIEVLSRSHIKKKAEIEELSTTTLEQFTKLLRKKHKILPLKSILGELLKKNNISDKVKKYLIEVIDDVNVKL